MRFRKRTACSLTANGSYPTACFKLSGLLETREIISHCWPLSHAAEWGSASVSLGTAPIAKMMVNVSKTPMIVDLMSIDFIMSPLCKWQFCMNNISLLSYAAGPLI